ncbi:DUF2798 domain-containing protein [Stenotrophomonas maltophilia]|nr:DUF2798 domain-containing protein [Stenotrophomonas maltophilia]
MAARCLRNPGRFSTANEFDAELPIKVLSAYSRAMPIAFVSLLAVRPVVFWLVRHTVRQS